MYFVVVVLSHETESNIVFYKYCLLNTTLPCQWTSFQKMFEDLPSPTNSRAGLPIFLVTTPVFMFLNQLGVVMSKSPNRTSFFHLATLVTSICSSQSAGGSNES